jgi:hypothetical protein
MSDDTDLKQSFQVMKHFVIKDLLEVEIDHTSQGLTRFALPCGTFWEAPWGACQSAFETALKRS